MCVADFFGMFCQWSDEVIQSHCFWLFWNRLLALWKFANISVFRFCYMIGSSSGNSLWQQPVAFRHLCNCKPSFRQISGYSSCARQSSYANIFSGRSDFLPSLRSVCVRHKECAKDLQTQRCFFTKQLPIRRGSSGKTFRTAFSSPAASSSVSKSEIPKESDVFRLVSLAKPEKWKLLGECTSVTFYPDNMFRILCRNIHLYETMLIFSWCKTDSKGYCKLFCQYFLYTLLSISWLLSAIIVAEVSQCCCMTLEGGR